MNWTAALWFVAIVASIPLVLWLLKRSAWVGAQASSGTARTVAVLPLSASQKVVTVEVGRGEEKLWLVLGVTPTSVTTLHTMAALPPLPATLPMATDPNAPMAHAPGTPGAAATFSQLLGRLRGTAPPSDEATRRRRPDDTQGPPRG